MEQILTFVLSVPLYIHVKQIITEDTEREQGRDCTLASPAQKKQPMSIHLLSWFKRIA